MSVADLGITDERMGGPARGSERTPPHDMLAEQSALGGMLQSKDAVADVIESLGELIEVLDHRDVHRHDVVMLEDAIGRALTIGSKVEYSAHAEVGNGLGFADPAPVDAVRAVDQVAAK